MSILTTLGAGAIPGRFEFWDESMGRFASAEDAADTIAAIVMDRFRSARQTKQNSTIYQGKSTVTLLREADYALEKRYTPEVEAAITESFGLCPTRYYGLSASKTVAIANWKAELMQDPGALISIKPTPNPRLPEATIKKIKEQVKQDLVRRMIDMGVGDPNMLIKVGSNRLHENVKQFLDDKADALRAVERAKINSAALAGAANVQMLMRDAAIDGDFREAYAAFTMDQVKYGIGIMRFPFMQRRVVLSSKQDMKGKPERVWKTIPTFAHVSPHNFFPMCDGRDVSTNTANMEYREFSKATLVNLASDPRYDRKAIEWVLEEYSFKSRTWLFPEYASTVSESGQSSTYWSPEEVVAVIYHEGFMTGKDLLEHGLSGYEPTKTYDVACEICAGRTIRLEVKSPTDILPRSYATTKYEDLGPGIWNCVGVPGLLQNTQDRVNILYHVWENNIDWSMRPPLQTNPDALKNPGEARSIRPGGKYEVSDMIAPGASPDPIRTIRGPSAQYQILYPLIQQLIRQADGECGVPDLSDMSTFGRGSLGELSARVSSAVRRVRSAAFSEDRSLGKIWHVLFEYVIQENPEVVENIDLDLNYIGVVGLLSQEAEKKAKMERLALVMQATQAGAATPEAAKFAYTDLLSDMGLPTDELGMENPLVSNAIAVAMQRGSTAGAGAANLAGIPQLDGRSGAMSSIPTAIAAPNGAPSPVGTPPPAM